MQFLSRVNALLTAKYSKFKKLSSFLDKSIHNGDFYRFTFRKRHHLISKANKLSRRVNSLRWELKVAALGGTIVSLTPFDKAHAQQIGPFVEQSRLDNPLRQPLPGYRLRPAAVDLDNDGDYDIVFSDNYSYLKIFINNGTGDFNETEVLSATFTGYYGTYTGTISRGNPSFADLDGDGNLDLIVGSTYSGTTRFFLNNGDGNGTTATFTNQTGPWNGTTGNPFYSINPLYNQQHSFVDFDGDGDLDVFISGRASANDEPQLLYYENTGSAVFVPGSIPGLPTLYGYDYGNPIKALVSDVDLDGELDITVGGPGGDLIFFKGTGSTFLKQTGPWNPSNKSGNPFDGILLVNGAALPSFIDYDLDGDFDLVIGYNQQFLNRIEPLAYVENKGNAVFERKTFLDNPVGGVSTGGIGTVHFVDIDGDGEIDALLGGKYGNAVAYYKNTDGKFSNESLGSEFEDIVSSFSSFEGAVPIAIDIDDDGDLDLVTGSYYGRITFFSNNDGVLELQVMDSSNPFHAVGSYTNYNSDTGNYYSVFTGGISYLDLVDIDNDGDVDLFVNSGTGEILFFENTGDKQNPNFEAPVDPADNPLDKSHITQFLYGYFGNYRDVSPKFVDIDHDGDFDLLLGGYYTSYKYDNRGIFLFENKGTPEAAAFELAVGYGPVIPNTYYSPSPGAFDADGDGDLDIFVGDSGGNFTYYLNENPAAQTTVNTTTLNYAFGGGGVVLDADLTLDDPDGDLIAKATVTIQNFQSGDEVLTFTPQAPVTGVFNTNTGVLTLTGTAPMSVYQNILQTVTYEYIGSDPGARKGKAGRTQSLTRSITFQTFDTDFTTPQPAIRTVNVIGTNQAPGITINTIVTAIRGTASIDLATLISDPDGNFDATATGAFSILAQPQSGATASINGSLLTIDYSQIDFSGNDTMQIQICDILGACTSATVNIQVEGDVIVRNGMSPNGDGLNDFFKLDFIEVISPENKVSIFNRWGDKVFEITNYNNDDRRFEGVSDDGKELSSGVYFYKIEFNNGLPGLKGYLTLKR